MKILIIGSEGFIGKRLTMYFQEKGHELWGADVIRPEKNSERFCDVQRVNPDFTNAFRKTKYDLCVNCSGSSSVPDSVKDPGGDFVLNTINVFNILDSIKKFQNHCKFINLSSAAVYGNPACLPVKEEHGLNPLSPYGFHKLQAELICREFSSLYNIPTCSLRIFSVFGPGLRKQLFWDLFHKAKTQENFTLFGTGNESRDFIFIDDLVKAIDYIAQYTGFNAEAINVGNGEEIFIKNAVSVFYSFFDKRIDYSFSGTSRSGDPMNWKADIRQLNALGYKQSVDFESGLARYYEWLINLNL